MAKVKGEKEGFGGVGIEQMQSPLSFQLEEHGTPAHLCDSLPEYDGEKMEPEKLPRDTVGWAGCGKGKGK
jgi:hypothetical protein